MYQILNPTKQSGRQHTMATKVFIVTFLVTFVLKETFANETKEFLRNLSEKKDFHENFCKDLPFECYRCKDCHDNTQSGMCIKETELPQARCLCAWGFTGKNSIKVSPVKDTEWSRNRIEADDCKKPCHYTANYWNPSCVSACNIRECTKKYGSCVDDKCVPNCNEEECKEEFGTCVKGKCVPDCDMKKCTKSYGTCVKGKCVPNCNKSECKSKYGKCIKGKCVPNCNESECKSKYGKCIKGKCIPTCNKISCEDQGGKCMEGVCKVRCCKNLLESIPPYSPIKSTQKEYCLNRCKYYELKEGVCEPLHTTPACDKLCLKLGGSCDMKTGRCRCCKDFTGPHARYEKDYITADYCAVWCPYENEDGTRNMLCVNPNWIKRAKNNQSKKMKFKL